MRTAFLAAAILTLGGCAGPGGARQHPPAARASETPVARERPSFSQKSTARRLRDGQDATGRIDVEGPLVR